MNSIDIEIYFDNNGKQKYCFNFSQILKGTYRIHSADDHRLNDQVRVYLNIKPKTSHNLRPLQEVVAPAEINTFQINPNYNHIQCSDHLD